MERGRLVSRVQLPYPSHFLTFPWRRDSPTPYWQHSPFPSDSLPSDFRRNPARGETEA